MEHRMLHYSLTIPMQHFKHVAGALALALVLVPGAALAHDSARPAKTPGVEVVITNAGNVLVRGATVTAVSGSTITATTTWSGVTLTWSVATDSGTSFLDRFGGTLTLANIAVGDTVSFAGTLTGNLSVKASAVKDWSRGTAPTSSSDDSEKKGADARWKHSVNAWFSSRGFLNSHR